MSRRVNLAGHEVVEFADAGTQVLVLSVELRDALVKLEDLGVVAVDVGGALLEVAHQVGETRRTKNRSQRCPVYVIRRRGVVAAIGGC
jgi:hypothetical protein